MKDKSLKEFLFYGILILIMVISLCFGIKDHANMDISYIKLIVYSVLFVILSLAVVKYPLVLVSGIFGAVTYSMYIYYYKWTLFAYYHTLISDYVYWLQGYLIGYEPFNIKYTVAFSFMFLFLVSILISGLTIGKRGAFALMALGTSVHGFFWFMYADKANVYLLIFLFPSILLYAYKVYKNKSIQWGEAKSITDKGIGSKWIIYTSIFLVISILTTYMLPFNIKALRWNWLNEKFVDVFPFVLEWKNDAYESYSYGFDSRYGFGGKNQSLGGPITLDESVLLTGWTSNVDTLYLRGSVKELYTGTNWAKSSKTYIEYRTNDTVSHTQQSNDIERYDTVISITPKKLLTSTIFAPNRLYKVETDNRRFYIDEELEAYFSKLITKNETYKVYSTLPYIDELDLRNQEVVKDTKQEYFQLPTYEISDRITNLAKDITRDINNDYDKIKAIEAYLRTNYQYTLLPSKLPIDKEFVDYFLFEDKKGYCTYFATSMAVLLRASNIPCRYVEGFLSQYEGTAKREIRASSSHAWVEVNFKKYGWINFEATPAYSTISFIEKKEQDVVDVSSTEDVNNSTNNDVIENKDILPDEELVSDINSATKNKFDWKISNIIYYVILLIITVFIIKKILATLIKELIIRKSKGNKYCEKYLGSLLWYFRILGYDRNDYETLREYSITIDKYLTECYVDMPQVINVIEENLYGSKNISESDRLLLESYRRNIKQITIKRTGVLKFIWGVYIINKWK